VKFANKISEIMNAFNHHPLRDDELDEFYYDGTMEYRFGDKYTSHIDDIFESCQRPTDQNIFLLLGHKGCGKSTELNNMARNLRNEGYPVHTVQCGVDLDLVNPLYTDLLIMLGEALICIAEKVEYNLTKELAEKIVSFWSVTITEETTVTDIQQMLIEAGVEVGTPAFLSSMIKFFAKIKAEIKHSKEKQTIYKQTINRRSSDWLSMIKQAADEITMHLNGKQPIIIFEDLDKLNLKDAWEIFSNYAATLTGVSFPIVYTFPIALYYDPRFAALDSFYVTKTLPMIRLTTMKGEPCPKGIDSIIEIIEKRATRSLFDDKALHALINKTGGSLRDLFFTINTASKIAERRGSETITESDAGVALNELKGNLTRRIERKHYDFLADIYNGNRQKIEDKEMLLEMLQATTVLEYKNGDRWQNVHPLIADFLVEQGLDKICNTSPKNEA